MSLLMQESTAINCEQYWKEHIKIIVPEHSFTWKEMLAFPSSLKLVKQELFL